MANTNPLAANLTLEQQKNLFGNAYLNMLWHCPTDQRFHYWVHLPDCYYDEAEHNYSLMVIIHGTGCATEEYIKQAKELSDKYHMAVLAPMFPGGLIQRDDFNSYKLLSCDGIRYDLILLDMIEDMAKRYPGVHTDKFFMFGHSGGGQFVNRFLFAHPDRMKACSIGAPLVPWGTSCAYMASVLGISMVYIPYAFLCYIVPLFAILYACTGWFVWKKEPVDGDPAPAAQ